jgi:multiple sugar transport system substrate-binding protein
MARVPVPHPIFPVNRPSRRRFLAGAAATAAAVSLAACGAGTATTVTNASTAASQPAISAGTAQTSVTTSAKAAATTSATEQRATSPGVKNPNIRFEMYSDTPNLEKWTKLAADLAKQDPSLRVDVVLITNSYTKYETEMAGGTPPDIMEFESKRMPTFAVQKTLYDLSPLAARSTTVKAADFYPVDWNRSQWAGKLYIYPYESKPALIFYNKTLFQNKQVPFPKYTWGDPAWTWDAFLGVAQKLSGGTGAQQTFGYYHPTWWVYAEPYIWSGGGQILDDQRTKSMLDQAPDQSALQFLQDLIYKYKVALSPADAKPGVDKMFYAGRIGMWFNNCGEANILAPVPNVDWDVAPLPLPPGQTVATTRAPADGYAIAAETKQIDAVWKAVDFFGSPESALLTEGVPSRKAVGDAGTYLIAKQPGVNWKNYSDGLANSRDEPVTTEFQDMDAAWGKEFSPYWDNKRTPSQLATVLTPITAALLQKAVRS